MTMSEIGKKIKSIRKNLSLTQEEFAEKIGINAKHLSRLELGTHTPSTETIKKISEIFNISFSELGLQENTICYSQTFYELVEFLKSANETELKICFNFMKNIKDLIQ